MSLYALTIKPPSSTVDAQSGDFGANGKQQIITANGSRLSIFEASRRDMSFKEVFSQDLFAIIRNIAKFRVAGASKGMLSRCLHSISQFSDLQSTRHHGAPSSLRARGGLDGPVLRL